MSNIDLPDVAIVLVVGAAVMDRVPHEVIVEGDLQAQDLLPVKATSYWAQDTVK